MPEEKKVESSRTREDYVKAHLAETSATFTNAFENKNAIYMTDNENIKKIHAIQEMYASKDGNIKAATIPAPESIYLLQVMKDRGITDPRIISLKNAKEFGLQFAKGGKSISITKFTKDKVPYAEKAAFVSELYAKDKDKGLGSQLKKSPFEVVNHRQDVYVREMVSYLKMLNEKGWLDPNQSIKMTQQAKKSAQANDKKLKPLYDEEKKRMAEIEAAVPGAETKKNDFIAKTKQIYNKNLHEKGASKADYLTLRKIMVDYKWPEKIAKNAFNMVSPNASFDKIRDVPLVERLTASIKKSEYYAKNMPQEKTKEIAR